MENNTNNGNQTIKINNTENNEYKWQKLNYFNKKDTYNKCKYLLLSYACGYTEAKCLPYKTTALPTLRAVENICLSTTNCSHWQISSL